MSASVFSSRALFPLAIVGVAVLVSAWFITSRPSAQPKPPAEQVWPVRSVSVTAADVQPEIKVFGEILATREGAIRALVTGRLLELNPAFRDGNFITAGTVLASIDPVDFENRLAEQRAELERAAALLTEYERELEWERALRKNAERQVALARRALERSEKLSRDGRESKKARDDADAALAANQQNLLQRSQAIGRLQSRVEQQRAAYRKLQATLALAERELAFTRVVAPFDGYVTDVRLATGRLVTAGESLGRLLSATELEVRFDLPEEDYARLLRAHGSASGDLAGRDVTVVWRLGDYAQEFAAAVTQVGAEIDPTLGGIEVIAALKPAAAKRGLRAGAFVEIRIPDVMYRDVYTVPARALSDDGYIYAVREGRLERVAVEVLLEQNDELLLRGDLSDGERIVARVFAGIGPGLAVREL